jgi:virulence-associated protein VagC
MGALPKPEPLSSELAELIEIEGDQVLRLPKKVHLGVKRFHVEQSGDSLQLNPVRPVRTREQIETWLRSMHELEAGEVIPGGRNQGGTVPKRIFEDLDD